MPPPNRTVLAVTKELGDISERAAWTTNKNKVEQRLAIWRRKSWYDSVAREFGLSRVRYRTAANLDAEWECKRLLGRGTFGVVGMWTRSENGRVVDAIAVKQFNAEARDKTKFGEDTIPWEMLIMHEMAHRGCENIVRMRKVTFFPREKPKQWRCYMDLSLYGTMTDLVEHYIQKGTRIPEPFLWQAFNDFAKVAQYMATIQFPPDLTPKGKNHVLLHLDLKHDNVLLGAAPPHDRGMNYPSVQVADWGLAEYTSDGDRDNSSRWVNYGTRVWMPPEQRKKGTYGRHWKRNVLGPPDVPYTIKHVIWQMAACIYGLMTLEVHNLGLDAIINAWEEQEPRLRVNGYSALDGYKSSVYSTRLCKLVEDCLSLNPELRPSANELRKRTHKGWEEFFTLYQKNGNKNPAALSIPRNIDVDGP